jgi:short-subunit dehydrogenase
MATKSYSEVHVAVTGESSGIGEAIVREYAALGAKVTLVARRREHMEAIIKSVGGRTQIFAADLSDISKATLWLYGAQAAFGPIDILVNNAGVQIVDNFAATDEERAEQLLRADLHSPLRLTRAVLPDMLARKSGTIVDIASLAAIAPTPGMVYYNAAKAGLAAASESLRGEIRGSGIHVVTVYPGPVDTPMGRAGYAALEHSAGARVSPQGTPDMRVAQGSNLRLKKSTTRAIVAGTSVARSKPGGSPTNSAMRPSRCGCGDSNAPCPPSAMSASHSQPAHALATASPWKRGTSQTSLRAVIRPRGTRGVATVAGSKSAANGTPATTAAMRASVWPYQVESSIFQAITQRATANLIASSQPPVSLVVVGPTQVTKSSSRCAMQWSRSADGDQRPPASVNTVWPPADMP